MKVRFLLSHEHYILYRDAELDFAPTNGMKFSMKFDKQTQLEPYLVEVVNSTYYLDESSLSNLLKLVREKENLAPTPGLVIYVREVR